MYVSLSAGVLSYVLDDGTDGDINLTNNVIVNIIPKTAYLYGGPVNSTNALIGNAPTKVTDYIVRLHVAGQAFPFDIYMGNVGGQPTWTNDQAGANQAAYDITHGGTPVFMCSGDGYGSVTVMAGGTATIEVETDTDYFAIRDSLGTVTTYHYYDYPDLSEGTYCIFASDADGVKGGNINTLYITGDATQYSIIGYSALATINAQNLPHLTSLPQVPDSAIDEEYDNIPLITSVSSLSPSSQGVSYKNLPSVTTLPAVPLSVTGYSADTLPLLTTLPDFNPASETAFAINNCGDLNAVGVLPKITGIYITGTTGITTSTPVDAIVNACDPSNPGTCAIGSTLLALRTSASDVNYALCITAGWTFS